MEIFTEEQQDFLTEKISDMNMRNMNFWIGLEFNGYNWYWQHSKRGNCNLTDFRFHEEKKIIFFVKMIFFRDSQWARKYKKVQVKKLVKSNTSISIFCNFKKGQKSIFELGKTLKLPHTQNFYFTSFQNFEYCAYSISVNC